MKTSINIWTSAGYRTHTETQSRLSFCFHGVYIPENRWSENYQNLLCPGDNIHRGAQIITGHSCPLTQLARQSWGRCSGLWAIPKIMFLLPDRWYQPKAQPWQPFWDLGLGSCPEQPWESCHQKADGRIPANGYPASPIRWMPL